MPSNLPALVKTWESQPNIPVTGTTNSEASVRKLTQYIWYTLEDMVPGTHFFATGSIVNVAGNTYAYLPAAAALDPAVVGNLVGKSLQLRGCTTAANNGDFTITAQTDVGGGVFRLEYTNVSGVAEALAGSVKTIGWHGFTTPWVVAYTDRGGVSAADANDGVDRMTTLNASDYSTSGNVFVKILRNPTTGNSMAWHGGITSAAQTGTFQWMRHLPAPFTWALRTGQTAATVPASAQAWSRPDGTGASSTTGYDNGVYSGSTTWMAGIAAGATIYNFLIHCMMSSDGAHTRLVAGVNGGMQFVFLDEEVANPSGLVAPYVCGKFTSGLYTGWHDNSFLAVGSVNVDRYTTNYDVASAYMTSEGYAGLATGRAITERNTVSGNQPMFRIGLHTNTGNFLAQAQIGYLKDIYWTHTAVQQGTTFPDNTDRDWIVVGNLVLPWPGAVPEFSF